MSPTVEPVPHRSNFRLSPSNIDVAVSARPNHTAFALGQEQKILLNISSARWPTKKTRQVPNTRSRPTIKRPPRTMSQRHIVHVSWRNRGPRVFVGIKQASSKENKNKNADDRNAIMASTIFPQGSPRFDPSTKGSRQFITDGRDVRRFRRLSAERSSRRIHPCRYRRGWPRQSSSAHHLLLNARPSYAEMLTIRIGSLTS